MVLPETWPPELIAVSIISSAVLVAPRKLSRLAAAGRAFGDAEQRGLGLLDLLHRLDLFGGVERVLDQLAADADQLAQQREVVDLLASSRGASRPWPSAVSRAR